MKHPREIYAESPQQLQQSLENSAMDVRERELRTNALILKKLSAIERPHWSLAPLFWVSVVAAVAACIAAYPVLFSSQAPQSTQAAPLVPAADGTYQMQLHNLPQPQTGKTKK